MVETKGQQFFDTRRPRPPIAPPVVADLAPVPIEEPTALVAAMQEEKESESLSIEAQMLANFVPNEIAPTDGATTAPPDIAQLIGANDFEDDLRRANCQPGSALYIGWRDKLVESLSLAYALYLHVLLDPEKLMRLFEAPYFSTSRQRALPKKKVALAALQYVTKPEAADDRKSASAYATMLIYARHKGLTAKRFPVEMPNVTLQEARMFVRDLPRENALKRGQAPAMSTLTLSYRGANARGRRVLPDVSFSTDTERQSLAEAIVKILHELQASTP